MNQYHIGVIWSGVLKKDSGQLKSLGDDVKVYENVKMADVQKVISELMKLHVEIIVGTPGTKSEIKKYSKVPYVISYNDYIDVLETIQAMEKNHPDYQRIAVVLHEDNLIEEKHLQQFCNAEVHLFKYHNQEDLSQIVAEIWQRGYQLVIGGPTAFSIASQYKDMKSAILGYNGSSLRRGVQKAREALGMIAVAERDAAQLRSTIDNIPSGLLLVNPDHTIQLANKQMADILGCRKDDLAGEIVETVLQDDAVGDALAKGTVTSEKIIHLKEESYFLTVKPILRYDQVISAVCLLRGAESIRNMENKYRYVQTSGMVAKYHFTDIIGQSNAIREAVEQAQLFAKYDLTVLIQGETGTGKELFAQSIHNASSRKKGPFVAINCATLTESLLESELMGYDEGAFTGARRGGRAGLFEQAHGGTLFLDEINQMTLSLQAKVLRVIQEKTVMHIGGNKLIPVDVRIIAASNENLYQKVQENKFRADLFYRINVLSFRIPPLREREGDVRLITDHFLNTLQIGNQHKSLRSEEILTPVIGYSWPGNVRELRNYVERAMVLGVQHMQQNHLPAALTGNSQPQDKESVQVALGTMEEMENQIVKKVVEKFHGNKTKAADYLQMSRATIQKRAQ